MKFQSHLEEFLGGWPSEYIKASETQIQWIHRRVWYIPVENTRRTIESLWEQWVDIVWHKVTQLYTFDQSQETDSGSRSNANWKTVISVLWTHCFCVWKRFQEQWSRNREAEGSEKLGERHERKETGTERNREQNELRINTIEEANHRKTQK